MTAVGGTAWSRPESLKARIRWLLLARVLIVTVFLGITGLTQAGIDADVDFPLREVAGLIVAAYVASLLSVLVIERVGWLRAFAGIQILLDVALISTAVLLTGGARSPMAVWYNLAVIGGALLLFRRGAFATAALASLTYAILINLAYWEALPAVLLRSGQVPAPGFGVAYQIVANIGSFFSIAYLSSILVERLASTEQALARSEASRLRIETLQKTLVQNLESGVLTTDNDGRIESANHAVAKILGRRADELVGMSILEVLPVLRPPVGPKRILDPMPIPTELRYEVEPGGETRTLRCTSAILTDTYEQPIGNLYILQDVSAITAALESEDVPLPAPEERPISRIEGLIGRSPAMAEVCALIEKVAPTDSTVLITGESGTGKELAARAIHNLSPRRNKPMVIVNCAAIPENLIESELFGHVRGAFTGAVSDRRGLFRAADRGTIFLDEIGDLPAPLQVKLLRVLQERSFTPVGGQGQVAVDVRVIAATNRNLEVDIAEKRFREDLFYRLNVIRIEMPPLRERLEDLPDLIRHFLERFGETLGKGAVGLGPGVMPRLLAYPYPGNIRELEHVIEHAMALCSPEGILEEDLPAKLFDEHFARPNGQSAVARSADPETPAPLRSVDPLDEMRNRGSNLDAEIETFERQLLDEALRRAKGVRKRAAEILGINYRSLRHRLGKYGYGDPAPGRPSPSGTEE